jgi:hypothetical protein
VVEVGVGDECGWRVLEVLETLEEDRLVLRLSGDVFTGDGSGKDAISLLLLYY